MRDRFYEYLLIILEQFSSRWLLPPHFDYLGSHISYYSLQPIQLEALAMKRASMFLGFFCVCAIMKADILTYDVCEKACDNITIIYYGSLKVMLII